MLKPARIVLVATGRPKARAVAAMMNGQISTALPASLLQLHPNVEVILDLPSAEKLPKSRLGSET
jgi:glucosamine-6-phosphate deaminase